MQEVERAVQVLEGLEGVPDPVSTGYLQHLFFVLFMNQC